LPGEDVVSAAFLVCRVVREPNSSSFMEKGHSQRVGSRECPLFSAQLRTIRASPREFESLFQLVDHPVEGLNGFLAVALVVVRS
jgi:hypothetical protein